jgi:hypothetical protein
MGQSAETLAAHSRFLTNLIQLVKLLAFNRREHTMSLLFALVLIVLPLIAVFADFVPAGELVTHLYPTSMLRPRRPWWRPHACRHTAIFLLRLPHLPKRMLPTPSGVPRPLTHPRQARSILARTTGVHRVRAQVPPNFATEPPKAPFSGLLLSPRAFIVRIGCFALGVIGGGI